MTKSRSKQNSGFTLVEIIGVLALAVILMSVSVAGFFGYIRYAEYKKNTEYARTIFTAMQSSLTNERANGNLEELNAKLSSLDCDVPSGVTQYNGRLYYLFVQQGDSSTQQATLLKSLLNGYIYDSSVYNGTICVEFDPADGVVYSVFFYDKDKDFSYTEQSNAINISNPLLRSDDNSERRNISLGYWSSTLSAQAPGKFGKPSLSYLRLDNGDTLDLNWALTSRYAPFTQFLSYNVKLYDANNKVRFSLQVNTGTSNNILASGVSSNISYLDCPYEAYNESGNKINGGTISLLAYIDPNDVSVHLILDAVDLAAANINSSDKTYSYTTTSAMKLAALCGMDSNLSTAVIYAKVQTYGYGYTSSSWKQSSAQHILMGKDSTFSRFTLQSARHLFNMRFMCENNDYLTPVNGSYVQTSSFGWGMNNGIIASGKVYNTIGTNANETICDWTNSIKVTDTQRAFPSIDALNRYQTFDSSRSGLYINSIILNSNAATQNGLGLFINNNGTIQNLTFSNVNVRGFNNVGTVCSTNSGVMKNVAVSSGYVTGNDNVGGLIGVHNPTLTGHPQGKNVLSSLSNSAEVTGRSFVGGILSDVTRTTSVTLEDCSNYGFVHVASAYTSAECQYMGGIIGYCGSYTTVSGCVSSPNYSGTITQDMFKGTYIGGIAGINYGRITGSYTTGGYVVGDIYVGGIVGYNRASSLGDDNTVLRNKCMVYGNSYVGGIAGCNRSTIKNWSNEGIISATTAYCGGIVGANGKYLGGTVYGNATLSNCISNIDTSSISGEEQLNKAKQFSSVCDYAGGIAGYNYGIITAPSGTACNSVVAGRNYVGGIVGYNAQNADIVNCNVSNAYIYGENFVGGLVGLNLSKNLFDNEFYCNPRYVEGSYFVGGVIGANVIASPYLTGGVITMQCSVDNLQGVIKTNNSSHGAYIGGMIGYNVVLNAANLLPAILADYSDGLLNAVNGVAYDTAAANINSHEDNSYIGLLSSAFNIGDDVSRTSRLRSVTGNIYVGGIIGRNNKNTNLTVKNITNYSSVNALGTVRAAYNGSEALFSYSGGITGHVLQNTIIDNCTNNYMASVKTAGTYRGGLCEINEGIVQNCQADSQGASSMSYIGGLVGLNGGIISDCSVVGTIRGLNYVGGIASCNYGTITNSTISGDIYGYGENIGGVTGYNTGTVNGVNFKGSLYGTGVKVGAIVGLNNGGSFEGSIQMDASSTIAIQGNRYVGGFIGYNTGSTTSLDGLINYANVTAYEGFAGGIMGGMDTGASVTATNCTNNGRIQSNVGLAGGIVPYLSANSRITACANNAQVYAPDSLYYDGNTNNYYNGTFVAFNMGVIEDCILSSGSSDYTISGKGYVGGVVGYNGGTIDNITVTGTHTITVSGENGALYVGGIAGINSGGIVKDCKTDASVGTVIKVNANTNSCYVGGIAGYNTGSIETSVLPTEDSYETYIPFRAAVSLGEGISGYAGGIVGYNDDATVRGYAFEGTLSASGDEEHSYGGIAGSNAGANASVSYCIVNDKINTFSNSEMNGLNRSGGVVTLETSNNAKVPLGGIVGRNTVGSMVSHCTLVKCYIRGDYGYIGGIVGHNYGTVSECKADTAMRPAVPDGDDIGEFISSLDSDADVKIYMFRGDVGGVVGRNERYGIVNDCATGKNWFVLCSRLNNTYSTEDTDNTCAGIIGYNRSDADIINDTNYARVYKGNLSGMYYIASGIIGRQENTTSSTWKIENCINFGNVECGGSRAGGIIAQWKYRGGSIVNCANYGQIKSGNTNGVGGMVGYFYLLSSNQMINITDCSNHGVVSTTSGMPAGIVGGAANAKNSTINIVGCINTGEIKGNSTSNRPAGIINYKDTTAKVNLLRCVNYYRFSSTGNGVVTSRASSIKSCVCIPAISNPIGSVYGSNALQTDTQSYFLSDKTASFSGAGGEVTSSAVGLATPSVTTVGSGVPDTNYSVPPYMTDGNKETYYNYKLNTGSTNVLTSVVNVVPTDGSNQSITLNKVNVTFYASNNAREYFYKVYYKIKGDNTEYLLSSVGSGNNNEWAATGVINASNGTPVLAHGNNGYNKTVTLDIPATLVQSGGAEYVKVVAYINNAAPNNNWLCISELEVEGYYKYTPGGNNSNPDTNKQAVPLYYKENAATGVVAANYTYSLNDEMTQLLYYPNDTFVHQNYSAYKYWYDLHPEVENFIQTRYDNPLGNLNSVILSPENGGYKAEWNEVANALYYDADIYVNGVKAQTIRIDAGRSASFTPDSAWIGQSVYVKVTAYNGAMPPASVSKDSNTVTVKTALPEPVVVYELELEGTQLKYYCRLMNIDEYRSIAVANGYDVDEFLKNITVNAVLDGTSAGEFTAYEGRRQVLNVSGTASSAVILEANVQPKNETANTDINNYIQSSLYSIQTHSFSVNNISGSKTINCSNSDKTAFTGLSPEELSYKITLNSFRVQAYYRFEFVVDRNVGGITIPVAISSSENRITANGIYNLTGLSELHAGESYTMRGYAWKTQSDGLFFGHTVAQNITAAQLTTLKDSYRNVDVISNNALNDGYSVVLNSDGTYSVYYSIALACSQQDIGFVNIFMTENKTVPQKAAAPVPAESYTVNGDDFVFSWTADGTTAADVFKLKLEGTKADGSVVTILNENVTGYNYTANTSLWEYKNIKLSVTRLCAADSNGYAVSLGSTGEKEYATPLYLPIVFKPTVFIGSDKNNLIYDIAWNRPANQIALDDTAGYSVMLIDNLGVSHEIAVTTDNTLSSVSVDMEKFAGQSVRIYIIAKVKTNPSNYSNDSRKNENETAQLTISERLPIENPSYSLSEEYDINKALSVNEFLQGVQLTVTNTIVTQGSYAMQAAICSVGTTTDAQLPPAVQRLHDFAVDGTNPSTLTMASDPANSLLKANFDFDTGLKREYATQYLWFRVRAVPTSGISSAWSPWQIKRLPQVKYDKTDLTNAYNIQELKVKENASPSETDALTVKADSISFVWDEYADKYTVKIVSPLSITAPAVRSTQILTITRTGGSGTSADPYTYEIKDEAANTLSIDPANTSSGMNSYIWNGYLQNHHMEITVAGNTLKYDINAHINIQTIKVNNETTVSMVLPDFNEYSAGSNSYMKTVHNTYSVSMTAQSSSGKYVDSEEVFIYQNFNSVTQSYEWTTVKPN